MRGEYLARRRRKQIALGSPPLAWGIHWAYAYSLGLIGITPTCVGNTFFHHIEFYNFQDHPHLRGEYSASLGSIAVGMGSPPLAWGILGEKANYSESRGITPTCVGNTEELRVGLNLIWDHPHLRGEYLVAQASSTTVPGSPPLAWGILSAMRPAGHLLRITPTCVGNTQVVVLKESLKQDHPHLRGEYAGEVAAIRAIKGSPPLAWGIQPSSDRDIFYARITPTCVGNTSLGPVDHVW